MAAVSVAGECFGHIQSQGPEMNERKAWFARR